MGAVVLGRTGYSSETAKSTGSLTVAVRLRTDAAEPRKRLVLVEIVGGDGLFSGRRMQRRARPEPTICLSA